MSDVPDIPEFTDHDQRMIKVLDNLSKLQKALYRHAGWLHTQWHMTTDEPMPFFQVHEEPLGDGMSQWTAVFVLDEWIDDSGCSCPDCK